MPELQTTDVRLSRLEEAVFGKNYGDLFACLNPANLSQIVANAEAKATARLKEQEKEADWEREPYYLGYFPDPLSVHDLRVFVHCNLTDLAQYVGGQPTIHCSKDPTEFPRESFPAEKWIKATYDLLMDWELKIEKGEKAYSDDTKKFTEKQYQSYLGVFYAIKSAYEAGPVAIDPDCNFETGEPRLDEAVKEAVVHSLEMVNAEFVNSDIEGFVSDYFSSDANDSKIRLLEDAFMLYSDPNGVRDFFYTDGDPDHYDIHARRRYGIAFRAVQFEYFHLSNEGKDKEIRELLKSYSHLNYLCAEFANEKTLESVRSVVIACFDMFYKALDALEQSDWEKPHSEHNAYMGIIKKLIEAIMLRIEQT
jgi:hypothetical protein